MRYARIELATICMLYWLGIGTDKSINTQRQQSLVIGLSDSWATYRMKKFVKVFYHVNVASWLATNFSK